MNCGEISFFLLEIIVIDFMKKFLLLRKESVNGKIL